MTSLSSDDEEETTAKPVFHSAFFEMWPNVVIYILHEYFNIMIAFIIFAILFIITYSYSF